MMTLALAVLLVLGWVVAIAPTILGAATHVPRVFAYGVLAIGLMTILTPYTIYLHETIVMGGIFPATVWDFTILTVFSALGGAVMTVSRFWRLKKTSKRITQS